jgi:hypothetical protein
MNKLCSVSIAKDVILYDYCAKETVLNMLEFSDYVIVCYVESTDGTLDLLKSIKNDKLEIIELTLSDWNFFEDKNRLSYITNIAIQRADNLGFQYVFSLQMDEILHENSYQSIKEAVNANHEAYLINRINLWKDCNHQLEVPQHRKPCSTEVIRLAKSCYRTYDDAESFNAPAHWIIDDAFIFHYGFVRKKEVMKDKIKNMQQVVFGMADYDQKLNDCEVFDADLWFSPEKDLIPIQMEHPKVIQEWTLSRP